jgi:hypothetical protein
MHTLSTITAEEVVACEPAEVERFITSALIWALWPGVEAVAAVGERAFRLRQRLELPFFGAETYAFEVTVDEVGRDGRDLAVRWHTDGWQFARRGQWRARRLRTRTRLTLLCDDALDDGKFEHARNVYRATSIWPMRHGHNDVLALLTIDFLRDKLVADNATFVRAARRQLERRRKEERRGGHAEPGSPA